MEMSRCGDLTDGSNSSSSNESTSWPFNGTAQGAIRQTGRLSGDEVVDELLDRFGWVSNA